MTTIRDIEKANNDDTSNVWRTGCIFTRSWDGCWCEREVVTIKPDESKAKTLRREGYNPKLAKIVTQLG